MKSESESHNESAQAQGDGLHPYVFCFLNTGIKFHGLQLPRAVLAEERPVLLAALPASTASLVLQNTAVGTTCKQLRALRTNRPELGTWSEQVCRRGGQHRQLARARPRPAMEALSG